MALLDLGSPPALTPKSHRDYAPWLEHRCFDRACAYCMQHAQEGLEIDHVEPVTMAPLRERDPLNLLPSCGTCNGSGGKGDYHPSHSKRQRCATDRQGFLALDPRLDDYASLFDVCVDGRLEACAGPSYDRALWNRDVLFRLNRRNAVVWRHQACRLGRAADALVRRVSDMGTAVTQDLLDIRDAVIQEVAARLLFFELFDIPLMADTRAIAEAMRDRERGPAPT